MRMLGSKTSSWVIKQERRTDSQNYRLFCSCLRMLQSTGAGGLGTVKMFQALHAQSTVFLSGGKAVVIHLLHWFFMINRTFEGKLMHMG